MQVMKIFRFLFALLLTVILFACTDLSSYEKELEQIDNEADRLSALCDEINDKILTLESLAAQIGAREDITGVSQIQDENGYVTENKEPVLLKRTVSKETSEKILYKNALELLK